MPDKGGAAKALEIAVCDPQCLPRLDEASKRQELQMQADTHLPVFDDLAIFITPTQEWVSASAHKLTLDWRGSHEFPTRAFLSTSQIEMIPESREKSIPVSGPLHKKYASVSATNDLVSVSKLETAVLVA